MEATQWALDSKGCEGSDGDKSQGLSASWGKASLAKSNFQIFQITFCIPLFEKPFLPGGLPGATLGHFLAWSPLP